MNATDKATLTTEKRCLILQEIKKEFMYHRRYTLALTFLRSISHVVGSWPFLGLMSRFKNKSRKHEQLHKLALNTYNIINFIITKAGNTSNETVLNDLNEQVRLHFDLYYENKKRISDECQ